MASVRRIVVGLKSHEKSENIKLAKFLDCIVGHFHPNDLSVQVTCKLENNVLLLYPPSQPVRSLVPRSQNEKRCELDVGFGSVTLQHSPVCPVMVLAEDAERISLSDERGVAVAVALVVESLDERILMTQRSDHMRSFPRTWVPPGGHIEYGETLFEGGLRELEEETGLTFNAGNSTTHLLCLWESVYPAFLGYGNPKSHHIVIYLHTKAKETWKELQTKIKLDPEEVQGWTWLSRENVTAIRNTSKMQPTIINKYTLDAGSGQLLTSSLDLVEMFPSSLWGDGNIYSGSQMVLNKWLNRTNQNFPSCCKI